MTIAFKSQSKMNSGHLIFFVIALRYLIDLNLSSDGEVGGENKKPLSNWMYSRMTLRDQNHRVNITIQKTFLE